MDTMQRLLAEAAAAKEAREAASERYFHALRTAARYLVHDQGMTLRQAGAQLDMSHQRVHQLLLGADDVRYREVA